MPLFTLCLILFLTGCGKTTGEELSDEEKWENGQGELTEQIGNPNIVNQEGSLPPYHFFEDYIEVIDKTEYDMPTSQWFMHDDEGKSYTIEKKVKGNWKWFL